MRFVGRRSASSSCLRGAVLLAVSLPLVGPDGGHTLDAQQTTEEESLSAVRVALGGDDVLRAIISLWIVGSTARGFNGVTGTLIPPCPAEIRLVLPDGYLRIDHDSAAEARSGVAGSTHAQMSCNLRAWRSTAAVRYHAACKPAVSGSSATRPSKRWMVRVARWA